MAEAADAARTVALTVGGDPAVSRAVARDLRRCPGDTRFRVRLPLDDPPRGDTVNHPQAVDPTVPPSGPGCVECTAADGWWLHLRRCARCGHIGCCDDSPSKHATAHAKATGHPVIRSYEPGEEWFWDYSTSQLHETGPALAPPESHPVDQPVPGPAGHVPADWMARLRPD